jgi:ATP-dependent helicase/nuclease subunit A
VLPKAPITVAIKVDDWKREVAAIEDRWQVIVEPTYAVLAIKQSALKPGPKPHGAAAGGAEWGQVIHTLLDAKMKQPTADLRGLAISALSSGELPLTLVEDVVLTVERVIASELWRRAQGTQRFLAEVPVATPLPASKAASGLPTVLRGVIDLVILEAKGWVIVDYKSERVEEEGDLAALVDYYRPQIDAYAEVWEKIVGQPVVERGLFFTHTGRYITT